jgi:hypothetical protein
MSKKKKFSSRVSESVDPMSAFIDESNELAKPEAEPAPVEAPAEEIQPVAEEPKEVIAESAPAPVAVPEAPKESKKVDVLDMLHDTTMLPKVAALEKNAIPLQLQNQEADKTPKIDVSNSQIPLFDLLEVARQHANGYQATWDASIKAYARHMGFPAMASMEDCKSFLAKWGAKLKD